MRRTKSKHQGRAAVVLRAKLLPWLLVLPGAYLAPQAALAQQTLAQNQNLILTIGTIGLTWSGPLAAAIYLWGRLKAQLDSLAAPWQSMAEIVREIRTRA